MRAGSNCLFLFCVRIINGCKHKVHSTYIAQCFFGSSNFHILKTRQKIISFRRISGMYAGKLYDLCTKTIHICLCLIIDLDCFLSLLHSFPQDGSTFFLRSQIFYFLIRIGRYRTISSLFLKIRFLILILI